jgi:hypothetical protein
VYDEKYARVKHILFLTVDDNGAALPAGETDTKKAQFEKVLSDVNKPGASFEALMTEYNEDPGVTERAGFLFCCCAPPSRRTSSRAGRGLVWASPGSA